MLAAKRRTSRFSLKREHARLDVVQSIGILWKLRDSVAYQETSTGLFSWPAPGFLSAMMIVSVDLQLAKKNVKEKKL